MQLTPLKIPVMLTGIQSHRLQTFSSHLNADSRYNFVEFFAGIGAAPAAPPAGAARGLAAGDMIGVALVTGDVFNAFGFGTVTQVYDDKFVAFGHEALGVGHSALPVYRAITNGIVPSFANSYKSAAAYGSPIGTITKDLTPGIVGELGAPPPMIPVDISYHPANSNTAIEKHHRVAYGHEALIATVAASTMGAIRMESGPGTVEGTVTLHFQETETVYTETFRSVSTSPSGDVLGNVSSIITSFTEMTINNAGKATLKAVSISITDKPQLASADVAEVIAPEEIIPGESVTVGITLLPHWSAAGAERTIQRKVTLEIPEDFPAGAATINVSGSGLDFFGGGLPKDSSLPPSGILDFNSFGEEEEKPVPKTLDELIKQLEKAQVDPGLITVTLSPSGFGDFPGLPLGLEPPEGLLPPEAGGMQEGGEEDGTGDDDGEMPEDGNADWDGDMEPPEPIEAELIIDGFVVTGSKDTTVMIKGEEMVDGMLPPMQDEAPMEPAEPVAKE